MIPETKRCSACHAVKPAGDFWRDLTRPSGLMSRCKVCEYSRMKAYRIANRAKHAAAEQSSS